MAEFGVIASIIALAGSGIKVSIILFDLADRVGSAGDEVKQVASDITLFCSVLQAVQNALEDPTGSHYTPAALELVDQVIQHCKSIVDEIDDIVSSLVKEGDPSDFPSLEWTSRVKWTFKRSKVQVKRQTLESCKSTLHLLLTTLRWSRRYSSDRLVESEEAQRYKMVTQGLILATRAGFDNLRALEDAADNDHEEFSHESGLKRLPHSLNGLSISTKELARPTKLRRTSTWLDKLVFDEDNSPSEPHPGQRQHRLSSAATAKDPLVLLQKWTENRPRRAAASHAADPKGIFAESNFAFVSTSQSNTGAKLSRDPTFSISPRSTMVLETAETPLTAALALQTDETFVETRWKDKNSSELLSMLLRNVGLQQETADFELLITYGGHTRSLTAEDRPEAIIGDLTKYGLQPQLLVRRAPPRLSKYSNPRSNGHVLPDDGSFTVSPTTVKFADHLHH